MHVFLDAYQFHDPIFDMTLIWFCGLDDHNSAFHFPLDHVDFSITSAPQRFQSLKHVVLTHFQLQSKGQSASVGEGQPFVRLCL